MSWRERDVSEGEVEDVREKVLRRRSRNGIALVVGVLLIVVVEWCWVGMAIRVRRLS